MRMRRVDSEEDGFGKGAAVSGGLHAAVIGLALFAGPLFGAEEVVAVSVPDVTFLDAAEFDAMVSAAPFVPNEGPSDLAPPAATADDVPDAPAEDEAPSPLAPVAAPLPDPSAPDDPDVVIPPPPLDVPTEVVAPSIAEIPVIEPVPFQAPVPEAKPSLELTTAQAPKAPVSPAKAPSAPPIPEPVPADTPPPEETKEPEPEAIEAAEIEAPEGPAPIEAMLPVAKPADLAAAAQAAAEARAKEEQERRAAEAAANAAAAESTTTETRNAGNTTRSRRMSYSETRALSVNVGKYFRNQYQTLDPNIELVVRVRLNQSGGIVKGPDLVGQRGGTASEQNHLFQGARRAIQRAARDRVFAALPADAFGAWETIEFIVTPRGLDAGS